MIFVNSKLNVIDNSGGIKVKCIKILGNKSLGSVGDLLLLSLRKVNPKKKLLKGNIHKGVLVSLKKRQPRNGGYISIHNNAVVILNNNLLPRGTRILAPVLRELRNFRKFSKIISLATYVL